jgi:SPP1 family predicted phage head-tail adaptor
MDPARIRTADLRERITFEQQTPTKSTSGASIPGEWTTYKTVYAYGEQRSGSEQAQQQRIEARAAYQFIVRYDAGVTRAMRIKHTHGSETKYFNIANLENWRFRDTWLVIDAEEGRTQGK